MHNVLFLIPEMYRFYIYKFSYGKENLVVYYDTYKKSLNLHGVEVSKLTKTVWHFLCIFAGIVERADGLPDD